MALIDREHGVVRIKIVYDGPPRVGKTTTLLALKQKLSARQHHRLDSMDVDVLDYQGGMYDYLPIACQILSTPSHPQWQARRQFLLSQADAIVLVLDPRPQSLPMGLEYLRQLHDFLTELPPPVPQFLIQANFQDNPLALDTAKLHRFFVDPHTKIVESIADDGFGIRETFVLAVRLAVERLNTLRDRAQLLEGKLDYLSPESWNNILQHQQLQPQTNPLAFLLDT